MRPEVEKNEWVAFALMMIFYAGAFVVIRTVSEYEPLSAYGTLRIVGAVVFFLGFLVSGAHLDYFLKKGQKNQIGGLLMLSHAVMLGLIEWKIAEGMSPELLIVS